MPSSTSETRDGIELRESGAIRVWIDGNEFALRRPRVREYRRLRERLQDVMDEMTAAADVAIAEQEKINTAVDKRVEEGGEGQTPEERAAIKKMGRDLTAKREELCLAWWVEVGEALCERGTWPEPDDMPTWMGATESTTEIVGHWRSVPSLSGAR